MPMQVSGQPRPRDGPQIEADVEALRLKFIFHSAAPAHEAFLEIEQLCG